MELTKNEVAELELLEEKVQALKNLKAKLTKLENSKENVVFSKPILSVCGTFNR